MAAVGVEALVGGEAEVELGVACGPVPSRPQNTMTCSSLHTMTDNSVFAQLNELLFR